MKFSTAALVLATVALETASAGTIRQHAHKHVHEKKEAKNVEQAKRQWTPPPGYDWHTDTHTWANQPAATPAVANVVDSPPETQPTTTSVAVKATATGSSSGGSKKVANTENANSATNAGAVQVAGKTVLAGANSKTSNGVAWLGNDGAYVNTLVNNAGEDITVLMFQNTDGSTQWVDQHAAVISVKIPSGGKQAVSIADGVSGAFASIYSDTKWQSNGLLNSRLAEFTTAGADTTFDVSLEWANSTGHGLTIDTGNGCKSSTEGLQCAFYCVTSDGPDFCGTAGSYALTTSNSEFCNHGTRNINGVTVPEGGCKVTSGGTNIQTTFTQ